MMSMVKKDAPTSTEVDESAGSPAAPGSPDSSEEEADQEINMDRVRETMRRLKETTNYSTHSCRDDLKFIYDALLLNDARTSPTVTEVTEAIRELGLAPLFAAIYRSCFHVDWTGPSGGLVVFNMYLVAGCMWNSTDRSPALCQQVVDIGLVRNLLNYLNDPKVNPDRLNESGIKFCVRPMLSILHNVVQKCDAARKAYRDASAIDILPKFQSVADVETKCVVNFVLAYIVTEEENDKINEDDDNIAFIINMLRQVYNLKTGPKPHGFHTNELLQGLNKLANNDSNKVRIVRMMALPLYTELLVIGNQQEQNLAAQGIWRLAFRCKDFVTQEPGCIEALQKLTSSDVEEVSKEAKGALWELGDHKEKIVAKATTRKDSTALPDGSKHIMISYQWASQKLIKRIRDRLKEAGYKVWMDVDNMSKSPLEAMAAAVEDACVVLIAASRKYKDSESCRTEGVYAYNLRRDIVPLIVETGYRPDGWLGPLVLNNLYFDFSKEKTPFEQKMLELIKELGCRGKPSHTVNDNKVDVVQKVVDSSTVHAAPRLPINHTGNDRTHGEDVTDVPCVADDSVVKQPPPVTMQPPADAYTGCADCLCCFRPCHKHVKIHPEEQHGQPNAARAVHISWCCSMVDVEF